MSLELLEMGSPGGAYVGMAGLLSLVIGGNLASEFITQKAVFAATQLTVCLRASILEQWSSWILVFRLSQLLFWCILCILTWRVSATLELSSLDVLLVISCGICLGLMLHRQVARNSLRGIVPYQPAVGLDHRRSALHWQQCHHGHRHLWKEVHYQGRPKSSAVEPGTGRKGLQAAHISTRVPLKLPLNESCTSNVGAVLVFLLHLQQKNERTWSAIGPLPTSATFVAACWSMPFGQELICGFSRSNRAGFEPVEFGKSCVFSSPQTLSNPSPLVCCSNLWSSYSLPNGRFYWFYC